MSRSSALADVHRRARNLLLGGTALTLAIGAATTQFVAWRLNYDPALGAPIVNHAYWPWRIIEWWQASWEPQVATTFAMVKMGLLGALALGLLAFTKASQRPTKPPPGLHGTAQFLTDRDVKATGLLPDPGNPRPGIVAGGWADSRGRLRYLISTEPAHVLALGPTRSGKSAGIMMPTLLNWPHSAIVYDPKGELYQRTAGWRAKEAGNRVLRFAPADIANSARWNPLDRVRVGTPHEFPDAANIAEQLADPLGKGVLDHWESSAANFVTGVVLFCLHNLGPCGLSDVLATIDDPKNGGAKLLRDMQNFGHPQIAQIGKGMRETADRERASIISTARRHLRLFRDPVVARNTAASDFGIADLMDGDQPVAVYLEARGEDELRLRGLVRLFLTTVLGALISKAPLIQGGRETIPHRRELLLAIDEFASLGSMPTLEIALSKSAGAGIRALLLAQDWQQIVQAYGVHETITAHCKVQSFYAPNCQATAEWISRACGVSTIVAEDVSESITAGRGTQNRGFRASARPLLTADEVRRLRQPDRDSGGSIIRPGEMLVLVGGQVIRGVQALAFMDPEYRRRMEVVP